MFTRRSAALSVFALACSLFNVASQAQEYPNRAIKIIVPFAPGAASDTTTRFLAARLADRLKQPVVVENRPGAGAALGGTALKQAAADGYTLGNLVSAQAVQPWLVKDAPFDIRKDFTPLTLMYSGPMVLTVASDFPAKNLTELVAYAKANPGKLFAGTIGIGSATHLATEMLKQMTGTSITPAPFKDAADLHRSVASGQVGFSLDSYASPKPLVDGGRLRVLAVTTKERMSSLPNVPAIAETVPGFDIASWVGLGAPQGLPVAIQERLSTELRAIMQSPEWKQLMVNNGVESGGGTPQDFGRRISGDYEKFGKIIQTAGIKMEP
jgi:tripartite-type tricarboxylate transporter receptor subunit TctC